jgi:branched-chain amino acid transport system ATP-binding protein
VDKALLEVRDIHVYYGLAHILQGISLSLKKGEAVALLGRNGEGKTTTLKSILSLVTPKQGKIFFKGENITGKSPFLVARKGITMVPEGRHIFPALNVMEHLRVPVHPKEFKREDLLDQVFSIFPELNKKRYDEARSLSGGQQQMLVIARALMMKPNLLLLDEPMEGLSPMAIRKVIEALRIIKEGGVTLFFASTNSERAFLIADSAYIIEKGKIALNATKDELRNAPEIQHQYLGVME